MKLCTGEQWKDEKLHYVNAWGDKWHGCFGHLNLLKLDQDSVITNYGKHDRVVAFQPDSEGLYCRVDHLCNLGEPSHEEILQVARKNQGIKGKWKFLKSEKWQDEKSTDFYFVRA